MGEIAEAMLDGETCALCGSFLDCEPPGVPVLCHACHSAEIGDCNRPFDGMFCEDFYVLRRDKYNDDFIGDLPEEYEE